MTVSNPKDTPCEIEPYQFRMILPKGDQRDVMRAMTDDEYLDFMSSRRQGEPPVSKDRVTLLPHASKRYWMSFGESLRMDKVKPTAFYYKDKVLGNFTYR